MKVFVVLNPAAGQEANESVRAALERRFETLRVPYVIHETVEGEKPGELVRGCLRENFDVVVAVGGDGTVSAVADGLAESPVPLGIIPTGTGNLIARELGISTEVTRAVDLIAGPHRSRSIDAIRVGTRVFLLNVSIGVSASVIRGTTAKYKSRFGRLAYIWTVIAKLFTLKPRRLVVAVDGIGHEYHAIEVAIMNCGILAKMLYPKGPDVRIDDRRLDVLILGTRTLRDYPRYLFGVITARPGQLLSRVIQSERNVTIRGDVPLTVQADGDIIGMTPIDVEVLPGAVTVLVPQEEE